LTGLKITGNVQIVWLKQKGVFSVTEIRILNEETETLGDNIK